MPLDPGPLRWVLPDPSMAPAQAEALALGADLQPATMLAGYRTGLFAMPDRGRKRGRLVWWSPNPRGILPLARFRASRSLRRSCRSFALSIDQEFDQVVSACADPTRSGGIWLTKDYAAAYHRLFELGWAHSVEVWRDGRLAGGLVGVEVGGLFCGETMVHHVTDASKAAVWAVVHTLARAGDPPRLFDVQWLTPHLASLGAIEVSRQAYLGMLPAATELPPVFRPAAGMPALEFLAQS